MDGTVVDRYFKTRAVPWRFVVADHLVGRGLVLGDHEEVVGLLLAEVLDEVYIVDECLMRLAAQRTVSRALENPIQPLHADLDTLPYPTGSFDIVVLRCAPNAITDSLQTIRPLLNEAGRVLVIVDGWPRCLGATSLLGMGDSTETGATAALRHGHSLGIRRAIEGANMQIGEQYTLLSTDRHEHERVFEIDDSAALRWIIGGAGKAATDTSFRVARQLVSMVRPLGVLEQCYPRYCCLCHTTDYSPSCGSDTTGSILISGKNRTTQLHFEDENLDWIRKYPNSHRQSMLHENARTSVESIPDDRDLAIPVGDFIDTMFGTVRTEHPIRGTPVDQTLAPDPANVDAHLTPVFDWLTRFHRSTLDGWMTKSPRDIERDLTVEAVELTDPPLPDKDVRLPAVTAHGDFFGSNIYLDGDSVSGVIDWEWATVGTNPIRDPGFFLLQLGAFIGDDFVDGIRSLFHETGDYYDIVDAHIKQYCEEIGIDQTAFIYYLPINMIDRIRRDLDLNKRLDVDWPNRVELVWDHAVRPTAESPTGS